MRMLLEFCVFRAKKIGIRPRWAEDLEEIKRRLFAAIPSWAGVKVALWAIYLGFAIGPGKGEKS